VKSLIVLLMACPLMVNGVWVNAHMTNEHHDPHEMAQVHLVHDHLAHHDRTHHEGNDHNVSGHVSDSQANSDTDHEADHDPESHVHLCYMALHSLERTFYQHPRTNPVSFASRMVGRVFSPPVPPPNPGSLD
jgi:hypothetical protein